ncbi:hypothetical protein D5R81_06460 [Parashewanella spongiae]|uniref:Uncharacterized protein n=1 Tax=Parashewanella spongiae TaxID=342950 RepID=A0A3A6U8G1_9GAMM|nr:hypothetical protein [Parashewanella spongiae]MCL1077587.1 hypothetical protein [Parashewanella spongiae]RJY18211.1 hypothetical protein D5R81_06460 [Parashewanella spongiae]
MKINENHWLIEITKDSVIRDCIHCHSRLAMVSFCEKLEHSACEQCFNTMGNRCLECIGKYQKYTVSTRIQTELSSALKHLQLSCIECEKKVKYKDINAHSKDCFRKLDAHRHPNQTQKETDFNFAIQLHFSENSELSQHSNSTSSIAATSTLNEVRCSSKSKLDGYIQLSEPQTNSHLSTTAIPPLAATTEPQDADSDFALACHFQLNGEQDQQNFISSTASAETQPTYSDDAQEVLPSAPPLAQIPCGHQSYQSHQQPEYAYRPPPPTYAQALIDAAKEEDWDIIEMPKTNTSSSY